MRLENLKLDLESTRNKIRSIRKFLEEEETKLVGIKLEIEKLENKINKNT